MNVCLFLILLLLLIHQFFFGFSCGVNWMIDKDYFFGIFFFGFFIIIFNLVVAILRLLILLACLAFVVYLYVCMYIFICLYVCFVLYQLFVFLGAHYGYGGAKMVRTLDDYDDFRVWMLYVECIVSALQWFMYMNMYPLSIQLLLSVFVFFSRSFLGFR